MKKVMLLFVTLVVAFLAVWLPVRAQNKEEAAVRETIEHYFRGHASGDGEHFKKAFHLEAKLFWIRDGKLSQRTASDYIAGGRGTPAPDEAQRKRRIASLDITGNAAIVKVVLDYPDANITDYMSLLKIEGEWKIINKTFVVEPKTRS